MGTDVVAMRVSSISNGEEKCLSSDPLGHPGACACKRTLADGSGSGDDDALSLTFYIILALAIVAFCALNGVLLTYFILHLRRADSENERLEKKLKEMDR